MHPPEIGDTPLQAMIAAELHEAVPEAISAFAKQLAGQGQGALAVLFYGSNLRSGALDGVLDFYLLVESLRDWHGHRLSAIANHLLPPNVSYQQWSYQGQPLRAKVAVLRLDQFERGALGAGLDTTLWARFAQPARLLWQRDEDAGAAATRAVTQAVITASRWAARLGPQQGRALSYWDAVFARTYAAELRVEKTSRAASLTAHDPLRYQQVLVAAWQADHLSYSSQPNELLQPEVSATQRQRALQDWARRARWGKGLNLLRLSKSVFTFAGGADYVAWKVQRHSGYALELSDWQRRHPLLAAPKVLWTLWRKGLLR